MCIVTAQIKERWISFSSAIRSNVAICRDSVRQPYCICWPLLWTV